MIHARPGPKQATCSLRGHGRTTRSTTCGSLSFSLRLLPHPELQLQQVWFRAAGGAGALAVAVIEGLTAVVELVDDALALVLLVRVPLEAVCARVLAVGPVGLEAAYALTLDRTLD